MRGIWRLGVVAAGAAASFALAITRFSDAAEKGCAQRVPEDPSYSVTFLDPPQIDVVRYRVEVTRAGQPVMGAEVCVNAYMQGMSAMATTDTGREVSPGTYEVSLSFEMGGDWRGRLLVTEPGRPTVGVPLSLHVGASMDDRTEGTTTTVPPTTVPATTTAPPTTTVETPPSSEAPADVTEMPETPGEPPPDPSDQPPGGGVGGGVDGAGDETFPDDGPPGRSPMPP